MEKYRYDSETLSYVKIKEKNKAKWKILFSRILIIGFIGYFIVGYLFVYFNKISFQDYLNIAGILGGIASSIGLFSIFASKIQKTDIEEIGIEYFKDVVNASENLKEKEKVLFEREKELGLKEKQLKQLEVKKAKLELLVQKTSMLIYLKDKLKRLEIDILKQVKSDNELMERIVDRERIINQLKELNIEIEKNNETREIDEIVNLIKSEKTQKKPITITGILSEILTDFLKI